MMGVCARIWWALRRSVEQLLASGGGGHFLLGCSGIALVGSAALAGALAYAVVLNRRLARGWIVPPLVGVSATLVTGAWFIANVRAEWAVRSAARFMRWSARAGGEPNVFFEQVPEKACSVVVLVTVLVLIAAALRHCSTAYARWVAVVCGALVVVTSVTAFELAAVSPAYIGCGDPEPMAVYHRDNMAVGQRWLVQTSRILWLMAAAGLIGVGVLARRRRDALIGRSGPLSAAFVLTVGATAFAATRKHAHDARMEVPHRPVDRRCPSDLVDAPRPLGRCTPVGDVPLLVLEESSDYAVEFGAVGNTEITTRFGVKRDLWKQINPGHAFPGAAGVEARATAPVRVLRLGPLYAAGYTRIVLLTRVPPPSVETATTGAFLLFDLCCGTEITLDPAGEPASHFATYLDLVRAAERARRERRALKLAP